MYVFYLRIRTLLKIFLSRRVSTLARALCITLEQNKLQNHYKDIRTKQNKITKYSSNKRKDLKLPPSETFPIEPTHGKAMKKLPSVKSTTAIKLQNNSVYIVRGPNSHLFSPGTRKACKVKPLKIEKLVN